MLLTPNITESARGVRAKNARREVSQDRGSRVQER